MNIKQKIGLRIREGRKAKKLTRKALAELTDDLNISRINNYERGERTPGPQEIKQLAKALDVSAAFLMCLTDEKQPQKIPGQGAIPILDYTQACEPKIAIKQIENEPNNDFIPINPQVALQIGANAFALKMKDESMEPELRVDDILFIDPDSEPRPNGFVLAKLVEEETVIIRRYKQLSTSRKIPEFELLPSNSNWAKIAVPHNNQVIILGSVKAVFRIFNTN